jgi:hypothetical protein
MAQLRTFFDTYADALTQKDTERVAALFAKEFMATGMGATHSTRNDASLRAQLAQDAQRYRQIGVDAVEVKNYLEAELGSGFWLTKVEWELLDEDLNTLAIFDSTYLVDAGGDAPKIVFVIEHNQHERLQDAGLVFD